MIKKNLILLIYCFSVVFVMAQKNQCDELLSSLKVVNDSSLKAFFAETSHSKIILFGESHGENHSYAYSMFLEKAINVGYNTIIIELPVSYTVLFKDFLNSEKYSKLLENILCKYVYNKKDFKKLLHEIYDLNKKKKLKLICIDIEHGLSYTVQNLYDLINTHKHTLDTNYLNLQKRLNYLHEKTFLYGENVAEIVRKIIKDEEAGLFNNINCLQEDYDLFKEILKGSSLNGIVSGKNYEVNERESFIVNSLVSKFKNDTSIKAIGFFGSSHVQLIGDSTKGYFNLNPLAKQLNESPYFKNKISTILLNYSAVKGMFDFYQTYLFGSDKNCFDSYNFINKKQYLFFINKAGVINNKLNNYNYILYL